LRSIAVIKCLLFLALQHELSSVVVGLFMFYDKSALMMISPFLYGDLSKGTLLPLFALRERKF